MLKTESIASMENFDFYNSDCKITLSGKYTCRYGLQIKCYAWFEQVQICLHWRNFCIISFIDLCYTKVSTDMGFVCSTLPSRLTMGQADSFFSLLRDVICDFTDSKATTAKVTKVQTIFWRAKRQWYALPCLLIYENVKQMTLMLMSKYHK